MHHQQNDGTVATDSDSPVDTDTVAEVVYSETAGGSSAGGSVGTKLC